MWFAAKASNKGTQGETQESLEDLFISGKEAECEKILSFDINSACYPSLNVEVCPGISRDILINSRSVFHLPFDNSECSASVIRA